MDISKGLWKESAVVIDGNELQVRLRARSI